MPPYAGLVLWTDVCNLGRRLVRRWTQLSPEEILQSPYVLIGTVDKQIEDLHARRERWGISYYVIFEPYVGPARRQSRRNAGGIRGLQ
jgi:hypothetical protein